MIVGLTGGIGSGKTTVANFFSALGIPVYISDDEAKKLMMYDTEIRYEVQELLGKEAYANGNLNKAYIAGKVFKDTQMLQKLNEIVHPRVATHFKKWYHRQSSPYVIKEAAILFENGGYKECDFMILVTAPIHTRIARVQKRDNSTEIAIRDRMNNQWDDYKKAALADITIENSILERTKKNVERIHTHILHRIQRAY